MTRRLPIAVLISGGGTNLQALIDACAKDDFPAEITCVISNRAEAFGLERAKKAGIPTHVVNHKDYAAREDFDAALTERLEQSGAELVCLAGFMRLLTPGFVRRWHNRLINIHPSLLPKFKGLDTHRRAIEAGEKTAGCTVHFVREEMDVGPIIRQAEVPVHPSDTPETLAARVLEQEHRIYPAVVRGLAEGTIRINGDKIISGSVE